MERSSRTFLAVGERGGGGGGGGGGVRENSMQNLPLRSDILLKTVVGCTCIVGVIYRLNR